MKYIFSAQVPEILEQVIRDHRLPAVFRENTSNFFDDDPRVTILGIERDDNRRVRINDHEIDNRWARITARKYHAPTTLRKMCAIRRDEEGEYIRICGPKYQAWQFMTTEERDAIQEDFNTHYHVVDVPHVHQNCGGLQSGLRFEDALVASGLPYGDNVD